MSLFKSLLNGLYTAVAWIIMQIHAALSHLFGASSGWSWGLSIVFLTIFVRLLIFPLFVKQIQSSRKMQELAPKAQELRKKYKNDKPRMNQEMVKLYQENGANPIGGCLPLVAQFPIFISLFTVLRTIAAGSPKYGLTREVLNSAKGAHIFGVTIATRFLESSSKLAAIGVNPTVAKIVIGITVVVSGTTTFLTMRQSMRRSMMQMPDNPMMQSQKYLIYFAPLFALTGLYWPFGLVLYWVTTNIWTLGQTHYVYRKYPQPGEPDKGATAEKGKSIGSGGGSDTRGDGSGGGRKDVAPSPNGSGSRSVLGRFLPKKNEPVQDAPPKSETPPKIVRQQPVRQTRSKRSGKR